MSIIRPLITSLAVILLTTGGYCQKTKILYKDRQEDYQIILESIELIKKVNGHFPMKVLMHKVNKALGLKLRIESTNDYLIVSSLDINTVTVHNSFTDIDEVNTLLTFLKPIIVKKLDSIKLNCDYPEYLSDLLLAISVDNSWLLSRRVANIYQKRKTLLFSQGLGKDSTGNFLIKYVSEPEALIGFEFGDKVISIGDVPCKYLGGGMVIKLMDSLHYHDIDITIKRNDQIVKKTLRHTSLIKAAHRDSLAMIGNTLYLKLRPISKNLFSKTQVYIQPTDSIHSVILDLQDCVGAELNEVCNMAGLFLNAGDTICIPKYINPESHPVSVYKAKFSNALKKKKVVVLINERTASGAEIIALALRTYANAKIIGRKSLGYCAIDMGISMGSGAFVSRTKVGELLGPRGMKIMGQGIEPDIKLESSENPVELALRELTRE